MDLTIVVGPWVVEEMVDVLGDLKPVVRTVCRVTQTEAAWLLGLW
jgi:hypothetical protein